MRFVTCIFLGSLLLAFSTRAGEIKVVAQMPDFVFVDPLQLDIPGPIPPPDGDLYGNPDLILGAGQSVTVPIYVYSDNPGWMTAWLGVHVSGDLVVDFDVSRVPFDDTELKPENYDGWVLDPNTGQFTLLPALGHLFSVNRWHPESASKFRATNGEQVRPTKLGPGLIGSIYDVGLGASVIADGNPPTYTIASYGSWWKLGEMYISGNVGSVYLSNEGFVHYNDPEGTNNVILGFGGTPSYDSSDSFGIISDVPIVTINGGAPLPPPQLPLEEPSPISSGTLLDGNQTTVVGGGGLASTASCVPGDSDFDGDVDIADFSIIQGQFAGTGL